MRSVYFHIVLQRFVDFVNFPTLYVYQIKLIILTKDEACQLLYAFASGHNEFVHASIALIKHYPTTK